MTTKSKIEDRAISGLPVDGHAVARVSRDRRKMTLRYRWPENVDARIWDGVRRAFMRLAHAIADETRRNVEIYDPRGWMLECVEPERAPR